MKENVLLIVVDCLRADMVYERHYDNLNNIRRLIEGGVSFPYAFTSSVTTTPSFSSILTGLYPARHGVRSLLGYKLNRDIYTLAQILKKHGYYTVAEVTGPLDPSIGLNRGFDAYNYRDIKVHVYTKWWRNFINSLDKIPQPWFILLHLLELHNPPRIPPGYDRPEYGNTKYERALIALDEKIGELLDKVLSDDVLVIFTGDHGEYLIETFKQKLNFYTKKAYKGIIRRIAKGPLSFLSKYGRKILIEVGHGFHVYEVLARVPLIFYHKKLLPSGVKRYTLASIVDIFPTVLGALNIDYDIPYSLDGINLTEIMREGKEINRWVIIEAAGMRLSEEDRIVSVRTPRYKYILWPRKGKEVLYDLLSDPSESKNYIKEKPEIASQLKDYLLKTYMPHYSEKHKVTLKIKKLKHRFK